jgi:hypothetical protein
MERRNHFRRNGQSGERHVLSSWANGALTAVDLFAYHPDGALTATFYSGAEALDGYAYTQYLLNTSGTLTEVIAVTAAGKAYIGS